jgi:hypothetical protein
MVPGLNTIGLPEPKSVRAYEVMFVTAQIVEVSIAFEVFEEIREQRECLRRSEEDSSLILKLATKRKNKAEITNCMLVWSDYM